jgi:hypothetical protein
VRSPVRAHRILPVEAVTLKLNPRLPPLITIHGHLTTKTEIFESDKKCHGAEWCPDSQDIHSDDLQAHSLPIMPIEKVPVFWDRVCSCEAPTSELDNTHGRPFPQSQFPSCLMRMLTTRPFKAEWFPVNLRFPRQPYHAPFENQVVAP